MAARVLVPFIGLVAGAVGLVPVAAAEPDRSGQYIESSATALSVGTGTGGRTEVLHRVLDGGGRELSRSLRVSTNPRFSAQAQVQAGSCHSEGARPGFEPLPVREAIYQGKNDFAHAQFFPYRQYNARTVGNVDQQQWLVCAFGGADGNNGSRVTKAGPGVAYRDGDRTWKLGHAWREGSTPSNTTISLGFQTRRPRPGPRRDQPDPDPSPEGLPRPPSGDDDMGQLQRNGVNGWWEHGCEPRCGGNGSVHGSSDYQGSVVEGLWEFPDKRRVTSDDFLMKVYWSHHCANAFGVCG